MVFFSFCFSFSQLDLFFLHIPDQNKGYTNLKVNSTAKVKAPESLLLPPRLMKIAVLNFARPIAEHVFAQTKLSDTLFPSMQFSVASI